jgi:hypothetical protein
MKQERSDVRVGGPIYQKAISTSSTRTYVLIRWVAGWVRNLAEGALEACGEGQPAGAGVVGVAHGVVVTCAAGVGVGGGGGRFRAVVQAARQAQAAALRTCVCDFVSRWE